MKDVFKLEFDVRDSELDLQGIVNNANYLVYFEHTRHQYLKKLGMSFSKMSEEKQDLFLISTYTEYKSPLRSDDKFYVTCKFVIEDKIRFACDQEIWKLDNTLIAKSYNIIVCIDGNNRNRPYIPELIKQQTSTG